MKRLFDVSHPMFRPLWVRLLVIALVLGWTAFEFTRGATTWAAFFGLAGAWLAYRFLIAFDPKDYEPKGPSDG